MMFLLLESEFEARSIVYPGSQTISILSTAELVTRKSNAPDTDRSFSEVNGPAGCWLSHSDMQIDAGCFFRTDSGLMID